MSRSQSTPVSEGTTLVDPDDIDSDYFQCEIVFDTYRSAHTDFYAWEQAYSSQFIESLYREPSEFEWEAMLTEEYPPEAADARDYFSGNSGEVDISFASINFDNEFRTFEMKHTVIKAPKLDPTPNYESCTPSSISLGRRLHGTGFDERVLFIPFVDEDRFPWQDYLNMFSRFEWEYRHESDTDVEQIEFETARRLLINKRMDIDTIDRLDCDRLPPLYENEKAGLLWSSYQRDLLPWIAEKQRFRKPHGSVRDIYIRKVLPPASNISARLKSSVAAFCPNLNCLDFNCRTHEFIEARSEEPKVNPYGNKVQKTSTDLWNEAETPCGDKCFLYFSEGNEPDDVIWDEDAVNVLREILKHLPDLLPCQLALLMLKPCYEIFVHRQWLISDEQVTGTREVVVTRVIGKARVKSENASKLSEPCHHLGPCDKNCNCIKFGFYCQRLCWCDLKCSQRWRGCRCKKNPGSRPCQTKKKCACRRAGRECDPELCQGCQCAKSYTSLRPLCMNSQIQRGESRQIRIDRSDFGFGAFLTTQVKRPNTLIGEYVGYILEEEQDTASLDLLYKFRGRNYAFVVGDKILDAEAISNETRFPNHCGDKGKEKCYPREFLVNGQYRMGIFTKRPITRGEEITFDYGRSFFEN